MDEKEDKTNFEENPQEVLPTVSIDELTRPIDVLKKSKKERDRIALAKILEEKKYYKRKLKRKMAKESRRKRR